MVEVLAFINTERTFLSLTTKEMINSESLLHVRERFTVKKTSPNIYIPKILASIKNSV